MLTFNPDKAHCTGCAACYSACPTHCIRMKADEEGFLYPDASEACIECGLCTYICPSRLDVTEGIRRAKRYMALVK